MTMLTPPSIEPKETVWSDWLFVLAFLLGVGQCLLSAWSQSVTYDEPNHWEWSRRIVDGENISRDLGHNLHSQTPVTTLNVLVDSWAQSALKTLGLQVKDWINPWFTRRLFTVFLYALLLISVRQLGRIVGGKDVGNLAAIATSLDPNPIAHGSLVTVDLPFACASTLVISQTVALNLQPSFARAAKLGIALGFAFSTKFTAALLLGTCLVAPIFAYFQYKADNLPSPSKTVLRSYLLLPITAIWCLTTIALAYHGKNIGYPFSELGLENSPLKEIANLFGELRAPIPREFLTGIDKCITVEATSSWNSVILNRFSSDGFWYYFPVLFLLKTPVCLLAATILGLAFALRGLMSSLWGGLCSVFSRNDTSNGGQAIGNRDALTGETLNNTQSKQAWGCWLLAALLFFLAYFCLIFTTQVGYRYVLFCLPLVYTLAALAWKTINDNARLFRWVITIALGSAIEFAPFSGEPLSFSNFWIYPKKSVYLYLADSNIEWAQNRGRLWEEIKLRKLTNVPHDGSHVLPGWNLISVNMLSGVFYNREQFRWVRDNLVPEEMIANTSLLFYLSDRVFNSYLQAERTVRATDKIRESCINATSTINLTKDGEIAELNLIKADSKRSVVCLNTPGGNLQIFQPSSPGEFGFYLSDGVCSTETIVDKKDLWVYLEPGVQRVCGYSEKAASLSLKLRLFSQTTE